MSCKLTIGLCCCKDIHYPRRSNQMSVKLSNGYILPEGKLTPNALFVGGIDMKVKSGGFVRHVYNLLESLLLHAILHTRLRVKKVRNSGFSVLFLHILHKCTLFLCLIYIIMDWRWFQFFICTCRWMKMKYGNTLPDMVLLRKLKLSHTEEGSAKGEFWSDTKLYRTGGLFGCYFRNIQTPHLGRRSDVAESKNLIKQQKNVLIHIDLSCFHSRTWLNFEVKMKNRTL